MKELTVDATIENIPKVLSFLEEELDKLQCNLATKTKINVAVDEVFSNIANYAYEFGNGKATVKLDETNGNKEIKITFIDKGKPYNPLEKKDPDTNLPLEQRAIGGLGIYIVKKSMDDVKYEYKDNQNILTLIKKL